MFSVLGAISTPLSSKSTPDTASGPVPKPAWASRYPPLLTVPELYCTVAGVSTVAVPLTLNTVGTAVLVGPSVP